MSNIDLCFEALAEALCEPGNPFAELGPEATNLISATLHARAKDSPGKTWFYAEAGHAAIFRALRMSPEETGARFAASAFRLHRSDAGPRILVAFPAPQVLNDPHADWLGINTVLSWNPVDDIAEVLGDPSPALVGTATTDDSTLTIHRSPYAFLRGLVEARAQWFVGWTLIAGDWRRKPIEPDLSPGLLLIGESDAVRWPLSRMPETIHCAGVDPKALNRALLKQARVPHARAQQMKAAA